MQALESGQLNFNKNKKRWENNVINRVKGRFPYYVDIIVGIFV